MLCWTLLPHVSCFLFSLVFLILSKGFLWHHHTTTIGRTRDIFRHQSEEALLVKQEKPSSNLTKLGLPKRFRAELLVLTEKTWSPTYTSFYLNFSFTCAHAKENRRQTPNHGMSPTPALGVNSKPPFFWPKNDIARTDTLVDMHEKLLFAKISQS